MWKINCKPCHNKSNWADGRSEELNKEEIVIGDEVAINDQRIPMKTFVVTNILKENGEKWYSGIFLDGCASGIYRNSEWLVKTGRHFKQVVEMLNQMKGSDL